MRLSRWLDHLPPLLAWGAVVSTDVYEPIELAWMASPLLLAAMAEWRRWDLSRWRRPFEIAALAALFIQVWGRVGLIPTTVNTLFLLCGIRLALPRELPQRRQILFMGFLLLVSTSVSTADLSFAVWALLWGIGAGLVMLQQAWEPSAALRSGPMRRPPYRKILPWSLASVVIASAFFLIMPRLALGFRPMPWGIPGISVAAAGFSDKVDLGGRGPIIGNSEVALRIVPPPNLDLSKRMELEGMLALLKGIALESVEGQRWEATTDTPGRFIAIRGWSENPTSRPLECYVTANPRGIIPLPYGILTVTPPPGMSLRHGSGGSMRWAYPTARTLPLSIAILSTEDQHLRLSERRRTLLTYAGTDTESALLWSRKIAPLDLPAARLVERLTRELHRFTYTLDNPSGTASNPLKDFLERTQAGHCEYFASALAFMLRHRGIPSRVVNGYRLGPWIDEGGYWVVTQNEAHSWVEYWDDGTSSWKVADPTPAGMPQGMGATTFLAFLQRWMDALRFKWDRHVVRFSDADQMAGIEWLKAKTEDFTALPFRRRAFVLGAALLAAGYFAWRMRRWRPLWLQWALARDSGPYKIHALRPLLRKTRKELPPEMGETARAWILRLARLWPEHGDSIGKLADEADRVGYGHADDRSLKELVKRAKRSLRE